MYKVMIADDEPLMRMALRSLVAWEEHGFEICLEAENGKQALTLFRNNPVDIMIVDINMPVMNGLELIEKVQDINKSVQIIVLSAYDDYNLVRKAFKLGARDYILKTEMEPANTLSLLKGLISNKVKAGPARDESISRNKGQTGILKREAVLRSLLFTQTHTQIPAEEEFLRLDDLFNNASRIRLAFLWLDDYLKIKEHYRSQSLERFTSLTKNTMFQALGRLSPGGIVCLSPQEYVLFLGFNADNQALIEIETKQILKIIRKNLLQYLSIGFTAGLSPVGKSIKDIPLLFKEAERIVRFRYLIGKGRNIGKHEVESLIKRGQSLPHNKEKELIRALEKGFYDEALKQVTGLFKDKLVLKDFHSAGEYYLKILYVLQEHLAQQGIEICEIFDRDICLLEEISKAETVQEIVALLKPIADSIIAYLKQQNIRLRSRAVIKALNYIKMNFNKSSLSLSEVSRIVQLNKSHLSHLFHKETGRTFIEFLTDIRIQKAKELLFNTNLKIFEISETVGFASTEHFCRTFKKLTGRSPKYFH